MWVTLRGRPLFCNFFTILAGPSGTGKTTALLIGKELLQGLPGMHMAPAALSKEKLILNMSKINQQILGAKDMRLQSPYAAFLDELSTFIRPKDYEFMVNLTDLYDNPKSWGYETLSRNTNKIENPFFTLLGGITPKGIMENIGRAAFGTGFTSRCNFIYSDKRVYTDPFETMEQAPLGSFSADLKAIAALSGPVRLTPPAKAFISTYFRQGLPPAPRDPRLEDYNTRREIHFLKLATVYCCAESASMEIGIRHAEQARDTLLEAEQHMTQAFEFLGASSAFESIKYIHQWLINEYATTKAPISELVLKRKLMSEINPQHIAVLLEELIAAGYTKVASDKGTRVFVPVQRVTTLGIV